MMIQETSDKKTMRAGQVLARIPSYLAAVTLFALMVITFCDVMLRSTINSPIEAASELTRIFMAIIVFSSLPIISWKSEHIVVDLLDPLFRGIVARIRDFFVFLICGAALILPAIRVWELAGRALSYGDTTEFLEIPTFYIAYFISIATFVTAFLLLLRALLVLIMPSYHPRKTIDVPPTD